MNKSRFLIPVCFLAALVAAPLIIQSCRAPQERQVSVNGTCIIKTAPDEMYWTATVSFRGATVAKAKARHDESLRGALVYLKSLGNAVKDAQTGGLSIDRQTYFANKEDRSKPFTCSTTFNFTLTDFDQYGAICDALAKFDGIELGNVGYGTSKEAELRRDALKRSLLDAHDKAGNLAATAGCRIEKPVLITEQSATGLRPDVFNTMAETKATLRDTTASTPSTPAAVAGQIEITAQVSATYDLLE